MIPAFLNKRIGLSIWAAKKYLPSDVWVDILKNAFEDLKQEIILQVFEGKDLSPAGFRRAGGRAAYKIAKQLGWQKQRKGGYRRALYIGIEGRNVA
ncbi:MAG: hypothetical protein ACTSRL_22335 [Candidatus Helarchaeota archaeon]